MHFSVFLGLSVLLAASQFTFDPGAYQHALQNHRNLANGEIQLQDLTPLERAEIAEIDRRLRNSETDLRTPRERCIDEQVAHHGGSPSALDREVIDLTCSGR